jgi:transcriptional regulator with XRE-family HTH domain
MPSPESSRRNLERARHARSRQQPRSTEETLIIKLLIWQSVVEPRRRPTQRELARQLGISQPYVQKIARRFATQGMQAMLANPRVTFEDLEVARERRFATRARLSPPRAAGRINDSDDKPKPWSFGTVRTMQEWQELEERKGGRRITFRLP